MCLPVQDKAAEVVWRREREGEKEVEKESMLGEGFHSFFVPFFMKTPSCAGSPVPYCREISGVITVSAFFRRRGEG